MSYKEDYLALLAYSKATQQSRRQPEPGFRVKQAEKIIAGAIVTGNTQVLIEAGIPRDWIEREQQRLEGYHYCFHPTGCTEITQQDYCYEHMKFAGDEEHRRSRYE